MTDEPAPPATRAVLWNDTADLTPRFWANLAAVVLLGDGGGDTSDRFRVDASENGLLIEDPSFATRRRPSCTTFVPWSEIIDIRLASTIQPGFVTILRADGTTVELSDGHCTATTRKHRFDELRRWFETYRTPGPG